MHLCRDLGVDNNAGSCWSRVAKYKAFLDIVVFYIRRSSLLER
jgi:hypothetical protein